MLDLQRAREIAMRAILEDVSEPMASNIMIIDTATIEKDYGWVFFYNHKRFIDTGDQNYALNGNFPVVVDKQTGNTHFLAEDFRTEEAIKMYERTHGIVFD